MKHYISALAAADLVEALAVVPSPRCAAALGGYLEAEDLVFVLDINSDYQPWLVELPHLFAAVNSLDNDRTRGLLLIEQ